MTTTTKIMIARGWGRGKSGSKRRRNPAHDCYSHEASICDRGLTERRRMRIRRRIWRRRRRSLEKRN